MKKDRICKGEPRKAREALIHGFLCTNSAFQSVTTQLSPPQCCGTTGLGFSSLGIAGQWQRSAGLINSCLFCWIRVAAQAIVNLFAIPRQPRPPKLIQDLLGFPIWQLSRSKWVLGFTVVVPHYGHYLTHLLNHQSDRSPIQNESYAPPTHKILQENSIGVSVLPRIEANIIIFWNWRPELFGGRIP